MIKFEVGTPHLYSKRDKEILAFISEVNLAEPKIVQTRPDPLREARVKDCFRNVEKCVEQYGGSLVAGWLFWKVPESKIYTEAHAVWQQPNGKRLDITPHVDFDHFFDVKEVLFSIDNSVKKLRGQTLPHERILTTDINHIRLLKFIREIRLHVTTQMTSVVSEVSFNTPFLIQKAVELGLTINDAKEILEMEMNSPMFRIK